jgi:hypothetical protein
VDDPIWGWPASRWELPAPEAFMLLHGHGASGAGAFKLALLELAAAKHLRVNEIRERGFLGTAKKTALLQEGERFGEFPPHRSLISVLSIFKAAPRSSVGGEVGVTVKTLTEEARKQYKTLSGYATAQIWPALVRRDLYREEEHRVLGIFPARRWTITPEGERLKADLERLTEMGKREFPGWIRQDPARAMRFLAVSGSAFYLMSPLFPHVGELRSRVGGEDGGAPVAVMAGTTPSDEQPEFEGLETLSADLSAFDGIDSAFSAIDSGVDSGGGGDGGDGGGDGGGD